MSTRLALRIFERPDADDPLLPRFRLQIWISFMTWNGEWTPPELAIIDTGAPPSLIPSDVWQKVRYLHRRNDVIRGIVSNPGCDLEVMDSLVACVLQDDAGQVSDVITIRAQLAPTKDVPLLLGFGGLLNQATVRFSIATQEATIEI